MPEKPTPEETAHWERWFAVECNNQTWDLAGKSPRTPEETEEMLHLAYAAWLHWSRAGAAIHAARADMTLAHAYSQAGEGTISMRYALRALRWCETHECEDWDLAFAHAEVAEAAVVLGDHARHREHWRRASELGPRIKDAEDRQVFLEEFAKIRIP